MNTFGQVLFSTLYTGSRVAALPLTGENVSVGAALSVSEKYVTNVRNVTDIGLDVGGDKDPHSNSANCRDEENYGYCLKVLFSDGCRTTSGCERTCGDCSAPRQAQTSCFDAVDDNFPLNLAASKPVGHSEKEEEPTTIRPISKFCYSVLHADQSSEASQFIEDFLLNFNLDFYLNVGEDFSCSGKLGKTACRYTCGECFEGGGRSCNKDRNLQVKDYRERLKKSERAKGGDMASNPNTSKVQGFREAVTISCPLSGQYEDDQTVFEGSQRVSDVAPSGQKNSDLVKVREVAGSGDRLMKEPTKKRRNNIFQNQEDVVNTKKLIHNSGVAKHPTTECILARAGTPQNYGKSELVCRVACHDEKYAITKNQRPTQIYAINRFNCDGQDEDRVCYHKNCQEVEGILEKIECAQEKLDDSCEEQLADENL